GDWLQGQGNLRGELIVLRYGPRPLDPEARAAVDRQVSNAEQRQRRRWLPAHLLQKQVRKALSLTVDCGFIRAAQLVVGGERRFDLDTLLTTLLDDPASLFLHTLTVDLQGGASLGRPPLETLMGLIAAAPRPALRALTLIDRRDPHPYGRPRSGGPGRRHPQDGLRGDYALDNQRHPFGRLLAATPHLRQLELRAPGVQVGALAHPQLERLVIDTQRLSQASAAAIDGGDLPALRELLVTFTASDYASQAKASPLPQLLTRRGYPQLFHLALVGSRFTNALVVPLARSPLLPALATLDLTNGALDGVGAQRLLERADAYGHLERLVLDGNPIDHGSKLALQEVLGERVGLSMALLRDRATLSGGAPGKGPWRDLA
ncbi:MAG: hypothetical protein ACFCBW_05130, partial [Candidatus Competibacterales bacterium]